jgi:hypothetical protein
LKKSETLTGLTTSTDVWAEGGLAAPAQERRRRAEFGDFQTPLELANQVCAKLAELGVQPETVIEPTCGVGAFVQAAVTSFPSLQTVVGFELNPAYVELLNAALQSRPDGCRVRVVQADFFQVPWSQVLGDSVGTPLILGNLPWVTNSALGALGSENLPEKSNFLNHAGFDAISGKANFDISEWMLLELLRAAGRRPVDLAMLVKTAVARKVLAHAERQGLPVKQASIHRIDAKKSFGAAVDACLLVIRLDTRTPGHHDYTMYADLAAQEGTRVGHRQGLTVCDIDAFEASSHLVGASPQKWRSGVKHDISAVMEFTRAGAGFLNGLGESVEMESGLLYPLLKGSDIGSDKLWREKFVLVTQHSVGEPTEWIRERYPLTWAYLERHGGVLDARGSTIYAKNPRFSVFGVGPYAFRPWRVAICGLYKSLGFRLVGPIEGKPVMFDDTVYYLSFDSEGEASAALNCLTSDPARRLLMALIFWDEKRPIKTGILNVLDWSRLIEGAEPARQMAFDL